MTLARPPAPHPLRPGLWEVGTALVAVVVSLRVLADGDAGSGFDAPGPLAYLLTALGAGTVVVARRQPLAALLITGFCLTALAWLDHRTDILPFVVTGLLFMVGSYCSRRAAAAGLAVVVALLALSGVSRPPDLGLAEAGRSLAIFGTAWALGRATGGRREALLALVAEAEQRAVAERELAAAERDRTTLVQVEERLRIARDLHDVLAHSISVVSVQATVGAHLAAEDPAAAREALLTISDVSRSSMGELRQMLTLLRDDTATGPGDTPPYEPARGLPDLEALVETYRSAGLPVRTSTNGESRPLSPSADLCAYRIVQEALTNTLKHAGPSTAAVALTYDGTALRITITDDGRGPGSTAGGHGLVGMRERTSLLGGALSAGPGPTGGFIVTATIPYEPSTAETTR